LSFSLLFEASRPHRALHSFPTRRSSDLSARLAAGYSIGAWLPYVTAGLAWARTSVVVNDVDGLTPLTERHHVHVGWTAGAGVERSEEHTSELQSRSDLVCRLLLEKKKKK